MAPQDFRHLLRVHEHAAHLRRLVGTAKPALDPVVRSAAWARSRHCRGKIAGGKTDQRIFRGQGCDDDLANLARSDRFSGPWHYQFEYDPFVEDHALAHLAIRGFALIGDDADIRGAVAL